MKIEQWTVAKFELVIQAVCTYYLLIGYATVHVLYLQLQLNLHLNKLWQYVNT